MSEITRRGVVVAGAAAAASAVATGLVLDRGLPTTGPPFTRGRGARTSFGSVALLASSRRSLPRAGTSARSGAHGHPVSGGDGPAPVTSAVHGAWTDAVVVDVEVHNGSRSPMELSPGQFRMRVDRGPSVSLYSSDREAGPVGPGSTTTMRIQYLAPPPGRGLSLEFDDTGAVRPVRLGHLGVAGLRS